MLNAGGRTTGEGATTRAEGRSVKDMKRRGRQGGTNQGVYARSTADRDESRTRQEMKNQTNRRGRARNQATRARKAKVPEL